MKREEKRDRGKDAPSRGATDAVRRVKEEPGWEKTTPASDVRSWGCEEEDEEDVPLGDDEDIIEDDPMRSP